MNHKELVIVQDHQISNEDSAHHVKLGEDEEIIVKQETVLTHDDVDMNPHSLDSVNLNGYALHNQNLSYQSFQTPECIIVDPKPRNKQDPLFTADTVNVIQQQRQLASDRFRLHHHDIDVNMAHIISKIDTQLADNDIQCDTQPQNQNNNIEVKIECDEIKLEVYEDEFELEEHYKTHTFKCSTCMTVFTNVDTFNSHRKEAHGECAEDTKIQCDTQPQNQNNNIEVKIECDEIKLEVYEDEFELEEHYKTHTFKCSTCMTVFTNVDTFNSHRKEAHGECAEDTKIQCDIQLQNQKDVEVKFECDGMELEDDNSQLDQTMESLEQDDSSSEHFLLYCNICGNVYEHESEFEEHYKTHIFNCERCTTVFTNVDSLNSHRKEVHGACEEDAKRCEIPQKGEIICHEENTNNSFLVKKPTKEMMPLPESNKEKIKGQKYKIYKDFCPFCEKEVSHFVRHLSRWHSSESEVERILSLMDITEKKIGYSDLRKRGNFIRNRTSNITLRPVKTLKSGSATSTAEDIVFCKHCLGCYRKESLYRHTRRCFQRNRHSFQRRCEIPQKGEIICHEENTNNSFLVKKPTKEMMPLPESNKERIKRQKYIGYKDFCPFCEKEVTHFVKHLSTCHSSESEVERILSLTDIREKKIGYSDLRKRGNFIRIQTSNITLRLKSGSATSTAEDIVFCKYCLGCYRKKSLYRHEGKCFQRNRHSFQRVSRTTSLLTLPKHSQLLNNELFAHMLADDILFIATKDPLICQFAYSYMKDRGSKGCTYYVKQNITQLAKLLKFAQERDSNIKLFTDILRPGYFKMIIDGINEIVQYDHNTEKYPSPTMALRFGYALKTCCDLAVVDLLQKPNTDKQREDVYILKNFIVTQWEHKVLV